ncbi:MAG: transglutaminase-like domain-containing protein, partial [Ginsengibacter sp.]
SMKMKNKSTTALFLLMLMLIIIGCAARKFHEVKVDNAAFIPDTAFIGYEDLSSPKFKALKEKYQLDTIFHGETGELQRILLLRNWISKTIKIDNKGPYPGDGSAEGILDEALKGHGFHCGHYTEVQNAVLNSYGYVTRCLLADVGVPVDQIEGEGHHAINEVWLNSYQKWFLSDAKYDYHFEKNGIPLSGLEIRDEYLKNKAADIELVKGPGRIPTANYPELKNRPKEKFARIYTWLSWGKYNNRYSNRPKTNTDYMIVYEDDYFKNHTWLWDGKPFWAYNTEYMNRVKDRKAIEWTPNTITSKVNIEGNKAMITLLSMTPNLKSYQVKVPSGPPAWKAVSDTMEIELKKKRNEIVLRTMNVAGVAGPEHKIIIEDN